MTFEEIAQRWRELPRAPITERLIRGSEKMREFLWQLLAPHQRGWFKACQDAVQRNNRPILDAWLNEKDQEKQTIIHFRGEETAKMMLVHLRCAAAILDPKSWPSIPPNLVLQEVADEAGLPLGFLRDLAEELLYKRPRLAVREQAIGAPLVEKNTDRTTKSGVMTDLILELMENGIGVLYPTPALAFVKRDEHLYEGDETFCQAEANACAFVRTTLNLWQKEWNQDLRWRLERRDSQPLALSLVGNSAGGAFSVGMLKLLVGD